MLIERSGIRGAAHARPSVLTLRNILEAMGQSVTLEFLTLPVNLSRFSICARFVCVTRLVFVFYQFRDIADNAFQCESSGFLFGKHLPDNVLPHLLVVSSHLIFSFVVVRGSILVIRWLTRAGGRILAVQHCPSEGYVNRSTVSVNMDW